MSDEPLPTEPQGKKSKARMEIVEDWAHRAAYGVTYLLMYVLNPGHTYKEIESSFMAPSSADDPAKPRIETVVLPDDADEDFALEEARRACDYQEKRREVVDDKSKVLLTVSALLLAANAAMLPQMPVRWLGFIPLIFVFVAVFLMLMCFRTYCLRVVSHTDVNWRKECKPKLAIAREQFECAAFMGPQNNMRIGIHRAARRAIILSLGSMAAAMIPLFLGSPTDSLVKQMNDPYLRALMRGSWGAVETSGVSGTSGK